MSDDYTREKRRRSIFNRNKHAKDLRENKAYKIRRVEDKSKIHKRFKPQEILDKLNEDEDNA